MMGNIARRRQTAKWNLLYLASVLLIVLLVFGFSAYAHASDGEGSASSTVTSSDSSGSSGDGAGGSSTSGDMVKEFWIRQVWLPEQKLPLLCSVI